MVVFGHAERDEDDPRKLSARRAQIAFAFLIGDYHAWGRIANEEKWGAWEQQHMLHAMGFYEGKMDGIKGPRMQKAIFDFISWLNEAECKSINPMLGLTEEYIRLELYRVYITGKKRAVSIPSSRFRTVSGYPYVGCGAVNRYKDGDEIHAENRRATFLLISETRSFPAPFPCKSGSVGPCEQECHKPGSRAIAGFRCKHYDDLFKSEKAGTPIHSESDYKIDWAFIAKMEGNRDSIYVPTDKQGNVLGWSGPTIGKGLDLGQHNVHDLKKYGFNPKLESKLIPYLGLRKEKAKSFVEKNPLALSESEVNEINQKVHRVYTLKAEAHYNEVAAEGRKFKQLDAGSQSALASLFFQNGQTDTVREPIASGDYVGAIKAILHFTKELTIVMHPKTRKRSEEMVYLSRRCQEAHLILRDIKDDKAHQSGLKLIQVRETEWEAAHGRAKDW